MQRNGHKCRLLRSLGLNGNGLSQLKNADVLGRERCALLVGADGTVPGTVPVPSAAPQAASLGYLQPLASPKQCPGHPAVKQDLGETQQDPSHLGCHDLVYAPALPTAAVAAHGAAAGLCWSRSQRITVLVKPTKLLSLERFSADCQRVPKTHVTSRAPAAAGEQGQAAQP